MNQNELTHNKAVKMTTSQWYEREKELFSLKSPHRPYQLKTMSITFRQTKFPEECN